MSIHLIRVSQETHAVFVEPITAGREITEKHRRISPSTIHDLRNDFDAAAKQDPVILERVARGLDVPDDMVRRHPVQHRVVKWPGGEIILSSRANSDTVSIKGAIYAFATYSRVTATGEIDIVRHSREEREAKLAEALDVIGAAIDESFPRARRVSMYTLSGQSLDIDGVMKPALRLFEGVRGISPHPGNFLGLEIENGVLFQPQIPYYVRDNVERGPRIMEPRPPRPMFVVVNEGAVIHAAPPPALAAA